MTICRRFWLASIGFLLVACSDPEAPSSGAADGTRAQLTETNTPAVESSREGAESPAPAFFGIQTRDHQLWLHYGTDPSLYTVKTHEGAALAERIDGEQLARDYPGLWEMYEGGVDLLGIGD